jgi:hypothetical protein
LPSPKRGLRHGSSSPTSTVIQITICRDQSPSPRGSHGRAKEKTIAVRKSGRVPTPEPEERSRPQRSEVIAAREQPRPKATTMARRMAILNSMIQ